MADDEAAFLAAIRAAPADRTAQLVYADWLEEQGDPRHELVRVCEAMRDEPPWGDRYWQLKARRNELCEHVPLEWLEATGYDGSYYDPVFRAGVPDDWRERWRLIREFTERWHGVAVPDVGGQRDVIAAEEARLGVELPPSVREFVAFMHDLGDYGTGAQTPLMPLSLFHCAPYQLEHVGPPPAVSLIALTLDSSVLGVLREDFADPDPPTYEFGQWEQDYADDSGELFSANPIQYFCDRTVTLAAFSNLFTNLPNATVSEDALAPLAAAFPVHARFDDADVFESDEMVVLVEGPRSHDGGPPHRSVQALIRRPVPIEALPAHLFRPDWLERYRRQRERERRLGWMSALRRQELARVARQDEEDERRLGHEDEADEPPDHDDGIPF